MTQDLFERDPGGPPSGAPSGQGAPGPGRLVVAGVVAACLAGVGLGMWARPAEPGEATPKPKPAATPLLQVVVADTAAGAPLDVSPAGSGPRSAAAPPPSPPLQIEPMAPRRPASGLVKVDAPAVLPPPPTVIAPPKPPRDLAAEQKAARLAAQHEQAREEQARKREAERQAERQEAARAEAARQQALEARLAKARLADAKAKKAAEVAAAARAEHEARAAEQARAERAAKLEKTRLAEAKAEKAKAARLAKASPKTSELARAEARPRRLADLVKAVRTGARQIARKAAVETARADPPPRAKAAPVKVARTAPPAPKPVLRGQGPLRVARADACASADPGEALVCADARLGARDRQLQQAYHNAEAAGVDTAALRRQQARWLQARAAAAREAPWAVEDVYVARISELRDQARSTGREN